MAYGVFLVTLRRALPMRDPGFWIQDAGFWILDTGFWILDTGSIVILSYQIRLIG